MAPNKPCMQTTIAVPAGGLIILMALVLGAAAVAQDEPSHAGHSVLEALFPICPVESNDGFPSSAVCAALWTEVAAGTKLSKASWWNAASFIPGCCLDLNALSRPGFSEECGCAFVKFAQDKKIPIDSQECSLAKLKERCKAREEEAKREEERPRKLGPCDRLLQQLAGWISVNPLDVTGCIREIETCESRCPQLQGKLGPCQRVLEQLFQGQLDATMTSPVDVAACGVELFRCKDQACKGQ